MELHCVVSKQFRNVLKLRGDQVTGKPPPIVVSFTLTLQEQCLQGSSPQHFLPGTDGIANKGNSATVHQPSQDMLRQVELWQELIVEIETWDHQTCSD